MKPETLPGAASIVADKYAEVWKALHAIGTGPLGSPHLHIRRALAKGVTPAELEQIAPLCIPTLGVPQAVAAPTWSRDYTRGGEMRRDTPSI